LRRRDDRNTLTLNPLDEKSSPLLRAASNRVKLDPLSSRTQEHVYGDEDRKATEGRVDEEGQRKITTPSKGPNAGGSVLRSMFHSTNAFMKEPVFKQKPSLLPAIKKQSNGYAGAKGTTKASLPTLSTSPSPSSSHQTEKSNDDNAPPPIKARRRRDTSLPSVTPQALLPLPKKLLNRPTPQGLKKSLIRMT
jgi:hypothetical protein